MNTYLQWLDLTDETQCRWALQHLTRKGLISTPDKQKLRGAALKHAIGFLCSPSSDLSEGELAKLDTDMKSAWASRKSRKKKEKAGITAQFIDMDRGTRAHLVRLSKRREMTIPELIADLIARESTLERDAELSLKREKEALRNSAFKKQGKVISKEKDRKIKELQSEVDSLWMRISNLAYELVAADMRLETGAASLSEEQEAAARAHAERLTGALRASPQPPSKTTTAQPSDTPPRQSAASPIRTEPRKGRRRRKASMPREQE
ncbi:MAG: hypothetical protein P1U64_11720 [Alcanivoracaceae bacterium]|nr:hypothetical protein [Alcanivoracaceae bacterium]